MKTSEEDSRARIFAIYGLTIIDHRKGNFKNSEIVMDEKIKKLKIKNKKHQMKKCRNEKH